MKKFFSTKKGLLGVCFISAVALFGLTGCGEDKKSSDKPAMDTKCGGVENPKKKSSSKPDKLNY